MFCKTNPNETMFTLKVRALVPRLKKKKKKKKNSTKWCERRVTVTDV